jgi:hypothetical protein
LPLTTSANFSISNGLRIYRQAIGNVRHDDVHYSQCEKILNKHAELKRKTILERKKHKSKIIETVIEIVS